MMDGRCLCGAVRIEVRAHDPSGVSVCHCALCRRWSGFVMAGFRAAPADVTVTGTVATYASSSFAERAWCPACGTHLWFRDTTPDGADYELMPGFFESARDLPLHHEVYADRAFAAAAFAGTHSRVSAADYEARSMFMPDEDAP